MNRRAALLVGTGAAAAGAWRLLAGGSGLHEVLSYTASPPQTADSMARAAGNAPTLGINLTPINYWSPMAFIDRLKASAPWSTYGVPAPMNEHGYPTGLNGQRLIATMIPCEQGRYVLSHDGDMDVRLQGGRPVSRGGGGQVFEAGVGPRRQLIIDAIRKPPTFMRFVNQKDAAAFASGEIFAPEFLEQLRGFDTLRFMDWMRTNSSTVTGAFPSTVASCSYAAGVPIEIMLSLAKKVGARPWLCIPHLASDALVRQMIDALRTASAGGPAPYLEYSNEVWNLGFGQARYAQQQAEARWGAGTPGGVFYGYRAGQIARLARGSGIRVVLGTQTVVPSRADSVWDGVRRSGASDRDFSDWIIAAYVAGTLTKSQGPTPDLASRNDVAGAIDNLLHSSGPGALSVDTMRTIYARQGKVARAHGLKLIAYEGNLHLNPIPAFARQKTLVMPFFEAIARSPESAAVMRANLAAFAEAGGSLACLYNLSSGPGNGGFFGVAESGSWSFIKQRIARQAPPR